MDASALSLQAEPPPLRFDADDTIRIGATRVTLDSIVAAFENGESPEEIARNYDALTLAEVYRAIGYYLERRDEVGAYVARRAAQRQESQREVEGAQNPSGIRARLLARRRQT